MRFGLTMTVSGETSTSEWARDPMLVFRGSKDGAAAESGEGIAVEFTLRTTKCSLGMVQLKKQS